MKYKFNADVTLNVTGEIEADNPEEAEQYLEDLCIDDYEVSNGQSVEILSLVDEEGNEV